MKFPILALAAGALFFTAPTIQAQPKVPPAAPNSPKEPLAEKMSLAKSAEFLDNVALNWTQARKCGACHTNYAYLMARPLVEEGTDQAMKEVRAFFEQRAANWDAPKGKPRWPTEVVATAVALAVNDARTTAKLHPLTRKALDRMWTLQRKDGAFDWLKCDWPPMEHDDYFGATYAAVGVGLAPENYAQTPQAKAGVAKLRAYFQKNAAPDLHHQAMRLWAAQKLDGIMDAKARAATVKSLLAVQRPDGGWSLPSLGKYQRHAKDADDQPIVNDPSAPSDGYGTGFVVYVLRQAGVAADQPQIRRGIAWLAANQRASGRWFTRSLSTDRYHFISHAGTAFAVMALEACAQK